MNTPEFYTETECGTWQRFHFTDRPWHPLDFQLLQQRSKDSVMIRGYDVHAIAFDNPACGHGNFLRWDCINGFNN